MNALTPNYELSRVTIQVSPPPKVARHGFVWMVELAEYNDLPSLLSTASQLRDAVHSNRIPLQRTTLYKSAPEKLKAASFKANELQPIVLTPNKHYARSGLYLA
jgi:hypothetical protein